MLIELPHTFVDGFLHVSCGDIFNGSFCQKDALLSEDESNLIWFYTNALPNRCGVPFDLTPAGCWQCFED